MTLQDQQSPPAPYVGAEAPGWGGLALDVAAAAAAVILAVIVWDIVSDGRLSARLRAWRDRRGQPGTESHDDAVD
jgi:hypothetical protein